MTVVCGFRFPALTKVFYAYVITRLFSVITKNRNSPTQMLIALIFVYYPLVVMRIPLVDVLAIRDLST